MNKDQAKGFFKGTLGKMQERAGQVIGSSDQRSKGLARQAEGRLQKAYGNVKAALVGSKHS